MNKIINWKSPLIGAAFLMATSAIGPGFITQTTKFTASYATSFGFAILVSVLMDIGAQLNIWRIISISNMYAQNVANKVLPGSGYMLSILIVFGGIAFNIGNIAGAGLGLNVLLGCSVQEGAVISCLLAVVIFIFKHAGKLMDNFAKILGLVMIVLTVYVAIKSQPPAKQAILSIVWPQNINLLSIITIVGGTVGGYISFAGAHRLLEAGITGPQNIKQVSRSAVTAILLATIMRVVLFLAVLGFVYKGLTLSAENPAATVFQAAAGAIGLKIFGLVLWSAAITSVVGSAFTSVTFAKILHKNVTIYFRQIIISFILFSTIVFLMIGQPVKLLLAAGLINGLILPFALAIILLAIHKKILPNYKHPLWLTICGWLVVATMAFMSIKTIIDNLLL
jgi:Mn2+/Fe2+ NRAMP family transporter